MIKSPSPKNNNKNKNSSFGKALFPLARPTTVSGTQSTSGDLSQVPCSRPPAAPECKKTGEDIHSRYSSVVFTPTAKILPSTFNVCASDKVERCTPLIEKKKTVCYLKMPVPASEEADGLQTPEVYSQVRPRMIVAFHTVELGNFIQRILRVPAFLRILRAQIILLIHILRAILTHHVPLILRHRRPNRRRRLERRSMMSRASISR